MEKVETAGAVEDPARALAAVGAEVEKAIVGQREAVESMLVALMTEGHALIEGVPGTAKTLMVKTLARVFDLRFKRVQFTPDLMPSDILGTNVFDLRENAFRLVKGPIFTDLLLADEINRSPAKTQSALLEAMEERQVTIDGTNHAIGDCFTVFATQNPVEYEGTYPLPEAELDRFLLKVVIDYPSPDEEDEILARAQRGFDAHKLDEAGIERRLTAVGLRSLRAAVRRVAVEPAVIRYVRQVVAATRQSPVISLGGGPRASICLLLASKAAALLRGRSFATPDDVKAMSGPVLRHRIALAPDAELEGLTPDRAVRQVLDRVEVPR